MRTLLRSLVFALAAIGSTLSAQAAYPDKAVRIVVPFPPGGASDVIARIVAEGLSEVWKVPVVVDNRAGADTQIAMSAVLQAAADGYTIGWVSPAFAINQSVYKSLPYDSNKDFVPIVRVAAVPYILMADPKLGLRTLDDLKALSAREPGRLNFSTSSSSTLIAAMLLRQAAGIQAMHVPYKGSSPSVVAVASGEVTYTFDTLPAAKGLIQGGRLSVLALSSLERSKTLPAVPTLAEAGLKDFEILAWFGMVGRASLPAPIVAEVGRAVNLVLAMPAVQAKLQQQDVLATPLDSEKFGAFIRAEAARYAPVVRDNNLQQ